MIRWTSFYSHVSIGKHFDGTHIRDVTNARTKHDNKTACVKDSSTTCRIYIYASFHDPDLMLFFSCFFLILDINNSVILKSNNATPEQKQHQQKIALTEVMVSGLLCIFLLCRLEFHFHKNDYHSVFVSKRYFFKYSFSAFRFFRPLLFSRDFQSAPSLGPSEVL